jgi:Ca2+-binding RTX toxin-like protein
LLALTVAVKKAVFGASLKVGMGSFAKGSVGFACVVAALLTPSLASAAAAYVLSESGNYHAARGEANDVTVTQDGEHFHIVDLGASITAGDGCQSVNEHEVTCTFAVSMALDVSLDDLDDSFSAPDITTTIVWSGGTGDDMVQGGIGVDWLWGGPGDDSIRTGLGADPGDERANVAHGGDGNDTLIGGPLTDELVGNGGADFLDGNRGRDTLLGGGGNDSLSGGRERDTLYGKKGHDTISGNGGNDWLYAQDGLHDTVKGGRGFDYAQVDRGLDSVSSVNVFF